MCGGRGSIHRDDCVLLRVVDRHVFHPGEGGERLLNVNSAGRTGDAFDHERHHHARSCFCCSDCLLAASRDEPPVIREQPHEKAKSGGNQKPETAKPPLSCARLWTQRARSTGELASEMQ
jgi:hypothetical protein